jgi:hypothetical protein
MMYGWIPTLAKDRVQARLPLTSENPPTSACILVAAVLLTVPGGAGNHDRQGEPCQGAVKTMVMGWKQDWMPTASTHTPSFAAAGAKKRRCGTNPEAETPPTAPCSQLLAYTRIRPIISMTLGLGAPSKTASAATLPANVTKLV